jgi:hypothetical protein
MALRRDNPTQQPPITANQPNQESKMKLTLLSGLLAAVLTVSSIGVAFAGGLFQNLPVVGASSTAFCSLFRGDGVTCAQNTPAGPSIVTGNELIPADTQLTGGSQPQTVRLPLAAIGAGPYQYTAPLTGASVTVAATSRRLTVDPAGTIAALTVVFPTASLLVDNQTVGLCSTQVVTSLTMTSGSGTTILNPVTALAIPPATGSSTCYQWTYRLANTSWYRS